MIKKTINFTDYDYSIGWGASTPVLIDLEKKTDNPLPQNQLLEGQVFDYTKTHPSCKTSEEKKTLICVDHDKNHSDGTCKGKIDLNLKNNLKLIHDLNAFVL